MRRIVLLLGILVFLSSTAFHAQSAEYNLRYSNFFPAPHKNAVLAGEWCKEIEKRTKGRVKITLYPGAVLTPPDQTYDGVVKGIADVGASVLAYTEGRFPLMEVVDLPLGYKSGYAATKLANEFYKKFRPKELDDVKVMYLFAHGPGILHTTKKPVYRLEDVKGLKIRTQGTNAKVVEALGGTPVGMPANDMYDALSRGIVEGVVIPYEAMDGWKLEDVIRYHTEDYGAAYTATMFVVMNKTKWNALPKDIQGVIEQINNEYIEKQGRLWDELDRKGLELVKKKGHTIIKLSPEEDARWAAKVRPVLDDYVRELKAKGLPGDEALKFALDYLKANDKKPQR
jgi:TRAP-type C4-dicarboxylate transport system substrate-binding protein